ncbi:MAG: membrane dipeptidase [Bacteroidaceae bacterium]|nr:membrane dipeptidase [Bacteroidaceae bacterium]
MNAFDWKATYDALHNEVPDYGNRPVIGITANFGDRGCELAEGYFRSVLEAGGIPFVIPPFEDGEALIATLEHLDGILFSGGGDLNPLYVGEEPSPALHSINPRRDLPELLLARMAYDRQIPMLGICRGIQLLAAALDGSVQQDIAEAMPGAALLKHSQDLPREYASHHVALRPGSLIHRIMQTERLAVNSFHHQAVNLPGPHLTVSATAPDGVIEAVESCENKNILGVQWHPECFILRGDRSMMPLFRWLVDSARSFRETLDIHRRILTIDSHCDTPMLFGQGIRFGRRDPKALVDLHKMTEGHLDASIMVAYLPQGERDEESLKAATRKADDILTGIEKMVEENAQAAAIARTPDELFRLKEEGKKAIMKGIENGYAIGRDLSRVEHFWKRGVVYMTLCHNGDNDICDSARGNGEHGGLSAFGREVVREMNRVGMMVDLSHAAESTFWDALQVSRVPIFCSHSSCRALCDHPRNLTDEQMAALARTGGVMQVTFYNGFLRTDGQATVEDAVRHINHAVSVMGIEHVGIGTDFDGDGGVPGIAHAGEVTNLTRLLREAGYNEEQLKLLWGGNLLRLMRLVQSGQPGESQTQS